MNLLWFFENLMFFFSMLFFLGFLNNNYDFLCFERKFNDFFGILCFIFKKYGFLMNILCFKF